MVVKGIGRVCEGVSYLLHLGRLSLLENFVLLRIIHLLQFIFALHWNLSESDVSYGVTGELRRMSTGQHGLLRDPHLALQI